MNPRQRSETPAGAFRLTLLVILSGVDESSSEVGNMLDFFVKPPTCPESGVDESSSEVGN